MASSIKIEYDGRLMFASTTDKKECHTMYLQIDKDEAHNLIKRLLKEAYGGHIMTEDCGCYHIQAYITQDTLCMTVYKGQIEFGKVAFIQADDLINKLKHCMEQIRRTIL